MASDVRRSLNDLGFWVPNVPDPVDESPAALSIVNLEDKDPDEDVLPDVPDAHKTAGYLQEV